MIKYLLCIMIFFPLILNAEEEKDGNTVIDLMIVSKFTGVCGVFSQMINFQQSTNMKGGDEFIIRFLDTEAARLGKTRESFLASCPNAVKKYNTYMKLLSSDI